MKKHLDLTQELRMDSCVILGSTVLTGTVVYEVLVIIPSEL